MLRICENRIKVKNKKKILLRKRTILRKQEKDVYANDKK